MRRLVFVLILAFGLTRPGLADEPAYTPADAAMLQSCLDRIDADMEANSGAYLDCVGIVSNACQAEKPENSSTIGMVDCSNRELSWWDDLLNRAYAKLRDRLDPDLFSQLRDAQRAWIDYRDKSCGFDYAYWADGTIRSIFYVSCTLQATAERAIDLREVVNWTEM